jgi:hypothetical protein
VNVADTLRAMGIEPARLDPAPPDPARMPGASERIGRNPKLCSRSPADRRARFAAVWP